MQIIELKKMKCKRCGHEWVPRKKEIVLCPKCKSPYFDKDRQDKEGVKDDEKSD